MAITTIAGVVAGYSAPQPFHKQNVATEAAGFWGTGIVVLGSPTAWTPGTPGVNGITMIGPQTGFIPYTNPTAGNKYLANWASKTSSSGVTLLLIDRLWYNTGLVVTTITAQSINMSALPARDRNGTTNGVGIMAALHVTTLTGNAAANVSIVINYTNSDGTAGRAGSICRFESTCAANTFIPFCLAAGDIGIRSIQGITLGTTLSAGAISLVLYRTIAMMPLGSFGGSALVSGRSEYDAIALGLPRIYNDSCLEVLGVTNTLGTGVINSRIRFTEG